MVKFRVIRIGDLIKDLVKIIVLIVGIIFVTRFFYFISKVDFKSAVENKKNEIKNKTFIECLDENLEIKYFDKRSENENIISRELSSVILSGIYDKEIIERNVEKENVDNEELKISVVKENNKEEIFNSTYKTVKVRNQTTLDLNDEILKPDLDFCKNKVLIFHTHTSESYSQSENYTYEPSGNFRTLDVNCNVIGVGNELQKLLEEAGIKVIHNTTFHDYPEYNGAYTRSLSTVEEILSSENDIDLVIDLHRDAVADSSYAPSVMIGDEKVAQLMFVLGTNEGGLPHPNWNDNLKVAVAIQEKANELYPGLFRPILLTQYRYNEHVTKGACIIEVGATGNTMEEVLLSMKYLAEVIIKL